MAQVGREEVITNLTLPAGCAAQLKPPAGTYAQSVTDVRKHNMINFNIIIIVC